jgi:hypothetical protein
LGSAERILRGAEKTFALVGGVDWRSGELLDGARAFESVVPMFRRKETLARKACENVDEKRVGKNSL